MPLPDSFIEDLKFKSDITDIVSNYVTIKRRGRNYVGLCPFHSEKTASFNVYPENGSFYCFGCGVGGDVITFIEKIENLDYIESVKFLAQRVGLEMPENEKEDTGISAIRMRIFEANREAARFFHSILYSQQGKKALHYLENRGLTKGTITRFGLGFAPNSRYELIDYLRQKGFKESELVNANLAFLSYNKRASSRFFNRVMFPIIDTRGNVVAFGGRTMDNGGPKYLNTSDTIVFKKSLNLFAMNFAKSECSERLILVEGYMDVIALNQAGFKNTVATLGTALTSEQAKLISRYTKEVVVCYDSDEAGQKAANRAISLFRDTGVSIKVLSVPNGKDPDEFMRTYGSEGPARFKKLIEDCTNDVEYQLQKALKKYDVQTSQGKIDYLKEAIRILAKIESRVEQEIYSIKLSELVGVDKATILEQVKKEKRKSKRYEEKKQFKEIIKSVSALDDNVNNQKRYNLRAANAEEALIAYMINHPEKVEGIHMRISPEEFCTSFNKRIYNSILERIKDSKQINFINISKEYSMEERSKIAQMLAHESSRNSNEKAVHEYIEVILNEKRSLKGDQIGQAGEEEILKYIKRLKEQKR